MHQLLFWKSTEAICYTFSHPLNQFVKVQNKVVILSFSFLSPYLSSKRTQRSLKCRFCCFFCLFRLFFFSIFFSAFSRRSRLSAGRSMWGSGSSSRRTPWSSSLCGSSWRKGSRREKSSWWPSSAGEAGFDGFDLLSDTNTWISWRK